MSDIIRLVTAAERTEAEETAYCDAAHAEAVEMLERALEMAKERRVSSVAVAFAFADRSYGSLIPLKGNDVGLLLGSVTDLAYRLTKDSDR